jgi:hypothetical protein
LALPLVQFLTKGLYFGFIFAFTIIAFVYWFNHRKKLTFIELFLFIWTILALFAISAPYVTSIFNTRILTFPRIEAFVLPFLLLLIVYLYINNKNTIYKIGMILIIMFCIFNVALIPTYIYSPSAGSEYNETKMTYGSDVYLANGWFRWDGNVLGGERTIEIFNGLGNKNTTYNYDAFQNVNQNDSKYLWLVVLNDDFNLTASMSLASSKSNNITMQNFEYYSINYNKVYTNNITSIFKIK